MRKREKQIKLNKKVILAFVVIIAIIVTAVMLLNNNKETTEYSAELLRSQSYDEVVKNKDEYVYDENNDLISGVQFDAFFLKDTDSNGIAESVRGTCNKVGSQATLYMELVVREEGYVENGTITINSNNFYFNTSIVKDNEIAENYISTNTKIISLNDVYNGTQKLIIGSVRSRRLFINKHSKVCNWK